MLSATILNDPSFICIHTHTHTHPFNGEARDSEWQWNQLGYMQVCTSLQIDNHASNPPLKFFTGQMPFLPFQPTVSKH